MESAVWSLAGTLIGAFVTWAVARKYYVAAARDLSAEADRVRNLLRIALEAMEDAEMVTLNRDAQGNPIGMVHQLHVSDSISMASSASADLQIQPGPEHHSG